MRDAGWICETKKIPLSKIQEQFWLLGTLSPHDTAYNIPLIYCVRGKLKVSFLKKALSHVLQNHEILRANIAVNKNKPYFCVKDEVDINDFFKPLCIHENYTTELYEQYVINEVHKSFSMRADKLLRVKVFQFKDITYLSFVFHHIIIDLHSKKVFAEELSDYYNSLVYSDKLKVNHKSKPYAEYTSWQNQWLTSDVAEKMRESWKKEFNEKIHPVKLPFQKPKKALNNESCGRKLFQIPSGLSKRIKKFSNEHNISPFVFLLSAYAIFLSRISNQDKLIVGVPFTNRRKQDFADTIGCFVNTLPVTINLGNNISILELINQVRVSLLKQHRKQEIPFIELNAAFNQKTHLPFFNVGFTFEPPVHLNLKGADLECMSVERQGAQLDLFLTMWDSGNAYSGYLELDANTFDSASINRLINTYNKVIESILATPTNPIQIINILSNSEVNFIADFNKTKCPYRNDTCLHRVFESQVDKSPDAPALIYKDTILSYQQTEKHVNRLANYMINKGVQCGDAVGICCERNLEMMIGILAILKTGAHYLPLQVDLPPVRMDEIITDANPVLILAGKTVANNMINKGILVFLEDILDKPLSKNSSRPLVEIKPTDLAYVLFTSGSTGKPKGTLIEHHSVMNRIGWMQKNYPLTPSDTLFQKTPITFDVSVWELFWWFFNGSKLVLLNHNGEKDVNEITKSINKHKISQIHFVPSMFSPFLNHIKQQKLTTALKSLRNIFLSGEALPSKIVSDFNQLRKETDLPAMVNLYGPTEATVDVSYYNCSNTLSENDKIYIGKPIDNTELYVVNSKLQVQPVGVKGELIICGVNLSRGYLNNSELTAKSFVNFTKPNGEIVRAYKTGDHAMLSTSNEIEYLGRLDKQVKIRGMRIELGEIEAKLMLHHKIQNAAVLDAFDDLHKTLIAYICPKSGESISKREMIAFIQDKLPVHMIPSQFIFMNKFPLTTSGKVNIKALPEPIKTKKADILTNPSSALEEELLKLWQEVLQDYLIGVTDNFFEIGGNSLLAIQLTTKINAHFNTSVTVVSVFEHTNIRAFSKFLNSIKKDIIEETAANISLAKQKRRNIVRKKRSRLDD
ncbi:non-ribosomal peptide synthetase [Saccharicrinis sp. GN24d3]|uniref:non-ribosomal peptide synthetase n=1 Tax=Saccharicrinis sp. GN24d3 TaxID=3458416 RepID=UPI004036C10D